jgi:hypothetical protein
MDAFKAVDDIWDAWIPGFSVIILNRFHERNKRLVIFTQLFMFRYIF